MSQELSLPHLLSCLTNKDQYKGTQLYILQVLRLNQQIYPLIDATLTQTLLKPKTTSMGRLLTLRFFKEILLTANFSLIDGLNQKIEEHIMEVAQYNKKSKEVNRGANYFSDTFKIKNDAEVQKISSSYVLLALEIIVIMAKWYLKDQDGEQSRFVQYYRELLEKGVVFPAEKELNFFKKDDQQKFKKNYSKWYENYLKYNQQHKEKQQETKLSKVEEPNVNISKKPEQLALKQLQKSRKIPQQSIQLQNLKKQMIDYKKASQDKDKQCSILQNVVRQQQKTNVLLVKTIEQQKQTIIKLQQEIKANNELSLQKQQIKVEECYQLIIHPPNNTEDLTQQIDHLQELLKNTTHTFNNQQIKLQNQLQQLTKQNLQLKQSISKNEKEKSKIIQDLQKEIDLLKQQKCIQQKIINKVQASFVVLDQPKIGTKQMQQKQMITLKQQILNSNRTLKDETNLNIKVREKLNLICDDEIHQSGHKRQVSRSLKKTQSQHRLTMNQTTTNTTGFKKTNNQNKLVKTAQSFKHKNQGSKMVTIFPFINNYFPILPKECLNFKQHCLNLNESNTPFFQNQWIKVTLSKSIEAKCFVQVYNKTNTDQKIKVMSSHPSFSLQGEKIKKLPSCTTAEFQITIGKVDLNMRCPLISIILGNHGISLTTTSIHQKIFHLPIPFTLLDIFKIKKPRKISRFQQKTIKFGVNRFYLGSKLPSIESCIPNLSCQFMNGQKMRTGQIEWHDNVLKLQVVQWSRQVSLSVQFADNCEQIMSLGKVILQILMYLLQD